MTTFSMHRYPHSRLFRRSEHAVIISGPHIQVFDTNTGDVLHSTANCDEDHRLSVLTSGPIRCAALSLCGKYLATSGDDKKLMAWEVSGLKLLSSREIPKKPTCINLTNNNDILVADKFGDIFRYPLHPSSESSSGHTSDPLTSHENPPGGQLILGHASLLTTFLLTADAQYIVTADRDEHIRVSWYPQGYMIESYCLGHDKYVSAVHIPLFSPGTLISGGGDPVLRLWDWMSGRPLRTINIFSAVQPFIVVNAPKRKRGWKDEDETKGKRRRRKTKANVEEIPRVDDGDAEDSQVAIEQPGEVPTEESTVLVVHKVASVPSLAQIIVFSVVGATAIFWFSMDDSEPCIRHQPFYKPVIDFNLEEDGSLWVLLDVDWSSPGIQAMGEGEASNCVEVRRWTSNDFSATDPSPLALSLNSYTLPATEADLKTLDLYSDLLWLPKNVEAEADSRAQDLSEIAVDDAATVDDGSNEKGMSKRELGRLKHKKALRRLQEVDCEESLDFGQECKRLKSPTGE